MSVNCLTIDEIFSERKKVGFDDSKFNTLLIEEQRKLYIEEKEHKIFLNLADCFDSDFDPNPDPNPDSGSDSGSGSDFGPDPTYDETIIKTDERVKICNNYNVLVNKINPETYKSVTAKINSKNSAVFLVLSIFNNKFDLFEYIKTNYFSNLAVIFDIGVFHTSDQQDKKENIYTALISSKNIAYINSFYENITNKNLLKYTPYYGLPSEEVFEYLKEKKLISNYDEKNIMFFYKFLNREKITERQQEVICAYFYKHNITVDKEILKKGRCYYLIESCLENNNDAIRVDYYELLLKYLDYVKNIEISSSILRDIFFKNYMNCYNIIDLINPIYQNNSPEEKIIEITKELGKITQEYKIFKILEEVTPMPRELIVEVIQMAS